jgi:hypothetical protein
MEIDCQRAYPTSKLPMKTRMVRTAAVGYRQAKTITLQRVGFSNNFGNREVGYWVGLRKPT